MEPAIPCMSKPEQPTGHFTHAHRVGAGLARQRIFNLVFPNGMNFEALQAFEGRHPGFRHTNFEPGSIL